MSGFIAIASTKELPNLTIICTPKYDPLVNAERLKEELGLKSIEIAYKANFNGYPQKPFNSANFDATTSDILLISAPTATNGFIENNFSNKRSRYFQYGFEISINEAIGIISKSFAIEHWVTHKYENILQKSLKDDAEWRREWHKQNEIRTNTISTLVKDLDRKWEKTIVALDAEARNSFEDLPIAEEKIEMNSLDKFFSIFSDSAAKNVMQKNDSIYKKYSDIYRNKLEDIFDKHESNPITVKIGCSRMCGSEIEYQVVGKTKSGTSVHSTPHGYCDKCEDEVFQDCRHSIEYITTRKNWVDKWVREYRKMGKWKIVRFDF